MSRAPRLDPVRSSPNRPPELRHAVSVSSRSVRTSWQPWIRIANRTSAGAANRRRHTRHERSRATPKRAELPASTELPRRHDSRIDRTEKPTPPIHRCAELHADLPHHPQASLETIAFVLAALTAGGGTAGYIRTGSVPSIVAGVSVGTLYGLGGYRMRTRASYGVECALAASVLLAGSSIPRAIRSQKPLPTGLSALALLGLWQFGLAMSQGRSF